VSGFVRARKPLAIDAPRTRDKAEAGCGCAPSCCR